MQNQTSEPEQQQYVVIIDRRSVNFHVVRLVRDCPKTLFTHNGRIWGDRKWYKSKLYYRIFPSSDEAWSWCGEVNSQKQRLTECRALVDQAHDRFREGLVRLEKRFRDEEEKSCPGS